MTQSLYRHHVVLTPEHLQQVNELCKRLELMYVGRAAEPGRRTADHASSKKYFDNHFVLITSEPFPQYGDEDGDIFEQNEEKPAIISERPLCNKTYNTAHYKLSRPRREMVLRSKSAALGGSKTISTALKIWDRFKLLKYLAATTWGLGVGWVAWDQGYGLLLPCLGTIVVGCLPWFFKN